MFNYLIMSAVKEDWILQRQGFPCTVYHLSVMLTGKSELTIGRKPGNAVDIVCGGKTVSRKHCSFREIGNLLEVKDLGSMNGIFINKTKIDTQKWTPLKAGDVVGVGANGGVESSDPEFNQYFLFEVVRTVVKQEDQGDENSITVPVLAEASRQSHASSLLERESSNEEREAARSIEMGREEATNVSQTLEEASSGKSQTAATARTAVNSNPFNDIKLSMKCEVKLKNWSAAEIRDYRHDPPPVIRPKRRRSNVLLDSDDDASSGNLQKAGSSRDDIASQKPSTNGKGKSLKPAKTQSSASGAKSHQLKTGASKRKRSSASETSRHNAIDSKSGSNSSARRNSLQPSTSKSQFTPEIPSAASGKRTHSDSYKSKAPKSTNYSQEVEMSDLAEGLEGFQRVCPSPSPVQEMSTWCDDDVIILDSDEETLTSQPKIKVEPLCEDDVAERSPSAVQNSDEDFANDKSAAAMGTVSSDEESSFFPILSQSFRNEIAAEEEEEERKQRAAQINPAATNSIDPHVATPTRSHLDRPSLKADGIDSQAAFGNLDKSGGIRKAGEPNMAKLIPMQPLKSRKSSLKKKDASIRSKIQEQQDLKSYTVSVNLARNKTSTPTVKPSTSGVPSKAPPCRAEDASEPLAKPTKKSAKPKAKVTTKTRGDMFVEDVVVRDLPTDSQKRSSVSSINDYRIPKRPRLDPSSDSEEKKNPDPDNNTREDPLDHLDCHDTLPLLPSSPLLPTDFTPQFKPPPARVSRIVNSDSRPPCKEGFLGVAPSSSSTSSTNRRPVFQPRWDAQPLGKSRIGSSAQFNSLGDTTTFPKSVDDSRSKHGDPLSDSVSCSTMINGSTNGVTDALPEPVRPVSLVPRSRVDQDDRPYRNASPEKRPQGDGPSHNVPGTRVSIDASEDSSMIQIGNDPFPSTMPTEHTQVMSNTGNQHQPGKAASGALPSLPRLPKAGILNNGTPRAGKAVDRKRVNFAEENQIREIEPREMRPPHKSTFPVTVPLRHVDTKSLIEDMLLRIVCWNYSWIAEQQAVKDEPPPLLQEVNVYDKTLPQLNALPVVSSFINMDAYLGVFFPLMLHEVWANISKDSETIEERSLKVVVSGSIHVEGAWTYLNCASLVPDGTFRVRDQDLMVLAIPLTEDRDLKVFGIAENVQVRKLVRTDRLGQNLAATCTSRRPDLQLSFNLRVKRAKRYEQLDYSRHFTCAKVTPLNNYMKQFCVNAELSLSPLCNAILSPGENQDAFKLVPCEPSGKNSTSLNDRQREAVRLISETILKTRDGEPKVALLQGPPGTGKSNVIVHMVIRILFKYQRSHPHRKFPRILICAPSNHAVDEIAYRLMRANEQYSNEERFNLLRIGVPGAIGAKIGKITLDTLAEKQHQINVRNRQSPFSTTLRTMEEEEKRLVNQKSNFANSIKAANQVGNTDEARLIGRKLEDLELQIEKVTQSLKESKERHQSFFDSERLEARNEIISQAHVICSTLNSCRNKEMERVFLSDRKGHLQDKKFLCCIIDEASQCTEPESLTPLALGVSKLVLIGDPEQLPATVTSQFAQKQGFSQSLFNRFFTYRISNDPCNQHSVLMLDTQYRMASSICQWPSKFFYGKKLLTSPDLQRNGPCKDYVVLNLLSSQESLDSSDGKSICNKEEAELVALIVKAIFQNPKIRSKSVGVITYYQRQKQCIIDEIRSRCPANLRAVEVNTVDAFQGQERDIVILSTVRAKGSNRNADIGFVSSLQRMNVALTRAKESLIICSHFPTLLGNEAWKDLIDDAKIRGVAHTISLDSAAGLLPKLLLPSNSNSR